MTDDIPKYKIIFLGDQGVGKSSILNRFSQDKFENEYQATIGLDFHSKNATINGALVRLLLYDTAGQEKFRSLIPMYIRDANIIIVVYDITNAETFTHNNYWINETMELKRTDAIFCLVGNKIDLEEKRVVEKTEAENFSKEKGFIFSEISAKTGEGVQELFNEHIFPQMVKKFGISGDDEDYNDTNGTNDNGGGLRLDENGKNEKKGGCCGGKKKKKTQNQNPIQNQNQNQNNEQPQENNLPNENVPEEKAQQDNNNVNENNDKKD
jgi:small GTP-binding protein